MQLVTGFILASPGLKLDTDWRELEFLDAANDPKCTILSHTPPQVAHNRAVENNGTYRTAGSGTFPHHRHTARFPSSSFRSLRDMDF